MTFKADAMIRISGTTAMAACAAWAFAGPVFAQDLTDRLKDDGRFDAFAELLRETEVAASVPGPATIFAPTDEAFRRLPAALTERLDDPVAAEVRRRLASRHVVPSGAYPSDDLPVEMEVLAEDLRLVVTYTRGALTLRPSQTDDTPAAAATMRARAVTEARVRVGDIRAGDVILHGIDMVLLPPDLDDSLAALPAGQGAETEAAPQTPDAAPDDDFAEQIAESDDGQPVSIVPEGSAEDLAPAHDGEGEASEAEVFVYEPEPETTADPTPPSQPSAATATQSDAPAPDLPGEIIALPSSASPEPDLPERTADEPSEQAQPDEAPAPSIDLAGEVISVVDLVGQPVRDGSGGELGEVVDVLISLDDATARTLVYAEAGGAIDLSAIGLGEEETVRVDMRRVSVDPVDGSVIVQGDAN